MQTSTPQSERSYTRIRARLITLALPAVLAGCAQEAVVTGPDDVSASNRGGDGRTVAVCHTQGRWSHIREVSRRSLASHLAHGDYLTTLTVSHDATASDDGSSFRRITDALASARAGRLARNELTDAGCRITIDVAAGRYEGTTTAATGDLEQLPLIVDVPEISLRGALAMQTDSAGRATGVSATGLETVLASTTRLPVVATVQTPLVIANGHPDGSAAHRFSMKGFVFVSGPNPAVEIGGKGILALRVNEIAVWGNRFDGGFSESIDLRASSGAAVLNHITGPGGTCDICLAAPGRYVAYGNKILNGGIPGITTSAVVGLPVPVGVEPYVLPATAEVWSIVRNNEVRDHLRVPVGVGIRVETVGTLAPNVTSTVHSVITDNLISNNRFGIIIHAGFPVAGAPLVGNADVTLGGNVIEASCQSKVLVSMSRHQRSLGLNATLPYLQNSSYALRLNGNLSWDDVWYDHPEGRGNSLTVDGATIANGSRQFYSAAGCPGL